MQSDGKYNDVLFGILDQCYNSYTMDNNDGFGRVWSHDSCSNADPADGTIFDGIFIRYLSDIMPDLMQINDTLAAKWINVIQNTVNRIQYNNQTGASDLYPCPLDYLSLTSPVDLNWTTDYSVWLMSMNQNTFLAMDTNGLVYNYSGNPITNDDENAPGWNLGSNNNGESYCIHNTYIDKQTNGKYAYLSAKTLGSDCDKNIWNGGNYGDVIQGSSHCERDELFYIELVDGDKGIYSIRCAKCNLSPDIDSKYHPMYIGVYEGGPGYNTGALTDEQFMIYDRHTKQQIMDLDFVKMKDAAMNQLTQYTQLQWFVAALKVQSL